MCIIKEGWRRRRQERSGPHTQCQTAHCIQSAQSATAVSLRPSLTAWHHRVLLLPCHVAPALAPPQARDRLLEAEDAAAWALQAVSRRRVLSQEASAKMIERMHADGAIYQECAKPATTRCTCI